MCDVVILLVGLKEYGLSKESYLELKRRFGDNLIQFSSLTCEESEPREQTDSSKVHASA